MGLYRRRLEALVRLPGAHGAYPFAVFSAAVASGLSLLFASTLSVQLPFMFGICAVMASTAVGGAGAGLAAAAASMTFEVGLAFANVGAAQAGQLFKPPILITVLAFDAGVAAAGETIHHLRRKGKEQARRLGEQEGLLRSIFDALPAAILVVDEGGVVRAASVEAGRLFDHGVAGLAGLKLGELIVEASGDAGDCAGTLETGETRGDGAIAQGRRRGGEAITLRVAHAWARTAAARLLVIMARDVSSEQADTRRIQELQDELIHMDRLTALGEMGTALAHELNQPLSAAANYLAAGRRMLGKLDADGCEVVIDALDEAGEEVLRAGAVLRRLRSFVSRSGPEQREVPVRELVMEAALLSRLPVRDTRAELKVDIEPGVGSCCVDRVQIQQVVLNLVRNATEAMAASDVRTVTLSATRGGDEVTISVRDTGPGIAPRTAARLFEPFNTSKVDGMGVGLAISRNIIESHGGRIWLAPECREGADFRFTLPCGPSGGPARGA